MSRNTTHNVSPFSALVGERRNVAFSVYPSPAGNLILAADACGLFALGFEGHNAVCPAAEAEAYMRESGCGAGENIHLADARRWLDEYFAGHVPSFTPHLSLAGTDFQMRIWQLLRDIPYGSTTTYGALARRCDALRGAGHTSARAMGQAVGANPVNIIIPCHRVLGADGRLTGFAGGIYNKVSLLAHEGIGEATLRM